MKFKVEKGTGLYQNFLDFFKKVDEVNKAAKDLVIELTGDHKNFRYYPSGGFTIFGGIGGICFETDPGKNWVKIKDSDVPAWRPTGKTAEGKALKKRFEELPHINVFQFNEVIGLKSEDGGHNFSNFGFKDLTESGLILISMPKNVSYEWYKPHPDMIEITEKEYFDLSKKGEKVVA